MAADQGGNVVQPPGGTSALNRAKVLEAITNLLAKKDTAYIEQIRKRARDNGLNLKGLQVSEDMIREALGEVNNVTAGQRWTPSETSAEALCAKAVEECEDAEAFHQRVRVVGGQSLLVLPKPDIFRKDKDDKDQTSQTSRFFSLSDGWTETIARVTNRRDGRVYVRLRSFNGWVCSRSRKDFNKVVLEVEEGKPPLEPPSMEIISRSRLARMIPAMTQEGRLQNYEKDKHFEPRRFRTTIMAQILNKAESQGSGATKLNAKEEFLADGAFLHPAENRLYLHLKDGRGWICERSKTDFSKLAVEPCGPVDDFLDEDPGAPMVRSREAGGKKVIMLEKSEAIGNDAEEPGTATAEPETATADVAMVFRSDAELWPEDMPSKAIKKALRLKLRRLYLQHGAKVKECQEDLKEVSDRAATFGRSCPAQKELLQYADALKKEAAKAKKAWVDAVKALLKENPEVDNPPSGSGVDATANVVTGAGALVSPVQVRGGRWYCAMLAARPSEDESGSGTTRQCGPLRMNHQEACEDLKRMQQAKEENLKRKSESGEEAPAPKKGKS